MKKTYTKPDIVFENFSLSASIATCQVEAAFDSTLGKWGCKGYQLRTGEVVFMSDYTGCVTVEADGDYNGFCYHVPTTSLNLFGS